MRSNGFVFSSDFPALGMGTGFAAGTPASRGIAHDFGSDFSRIAGFVCVSVIASEAGSV